MTNIYEFVYRGHLAEQALDRQGRSRPTSGLLDEDIAGQVSLDLLDDHFVAQARRMATVYTAIAAFENMVRDLVRRALLEENRRELVGRMRVLRDHHQGEKAPR